MSLLGVNYHYVDVPSYPYSGVNGISIKRFIKQIQYLRDNFSLIGLSDLSSLDIVKDNYCLITFDDGLACHYDVIFDLVKSENIPAIFFINTMPLFEKKAVLTHKTHIVRAKISPEEIKSSLKKFCNLNEINTSKATKSMSKSVYRYDGLDDAQVKYIINFILSIDEQIEFIDKLFNIIYSDEELFVNDWYLNLDQIKEMNAFIRCIGSHSHSHIPLSNLKKTQTIFELKQSKRLLENYLNCPVDAFSYPLGGSNAFSLSDTLLVKEAGYKYAFTMERKQNLEILDNYKIARIDCNDLPGVGKSPLFKIIENQYHKID